MKMISLTSMYKLIWIFIISAVIGCEKQTMNKLPVVDAGVAATIQLPVDSVMLTGSGKDEDGGGCLFMEPGVRQ
jgi:hypothetical protein